MTSVTQKFKHESTSEIPRDGFFFPLRGSNSRCRVSKEMSGHGKGRVKAIPKADRGIGKRVSQIVLKRSGHFSFLNAVIPERFF